VEIALHEWLSTQGLDFYGDGIFKRVAGCDMHKFYWGILLKKNDTSPQ